MRKIFLALPCLALLAPMFLIAVTASAPYDAWSDLDADGDIDIFDVVKIAGAYGTTGDPGKNVNVTNWPAWQNVTVKYAWNSSWERITISVEHPFFVPNTGGYKEISVGIVATYDAQVQVLWAVGGGFYTVDQYTVTGGLPIVKQYSVQGNTLMVDVYNLEPGDNQVYFDWYITA